jgi:hypothetical protein
VTDEAERHLDAAALLDLHEKRLPAEEEAKAWSHLESCGHCRAELALARSFVEGEGEEAPAATRERHRKALLARFDGAREKPPAKIVDVRAHPAWSSWLSRGLMAASLAFLVIAGWQIAHRTPTPERSSVLRATPPEARWEMIVWDPTPTGWPLEWEPVPGAASYVVRVQTESGDVLAEVPAGEKGVEVRFDVVPEAHRAEALYAVGVAVGLNGPVAVTRARFLPKR